jgi:A/G-specific adenine glycosylase
MTRGKINQQTMNVRAFRRALLAWYASNRRDLPWRRTRDPYRIWLSEVMLQQTRVAAVIPYYERFLEKFPSVETLANAQEQEVLAAWSGLGYYSRARNLHRAAKLLQGTGGLPRDYQAIRNLPGVGDYTAAAVASIAFDLPYPVLDGNVLRVLSRIRAEPGDLRARSTRNRLHELAGRLMDSTRPADFNQALMEIGATVCVPTQPLCVRCPVASYCEAHRSGLQHQLPILSKRGTPNRTAIELLVIERRGELLVRQRPAQSKRLAGFWELPEMAQIPAARVGEKIGSFRHTIVNTNYQVTVYRARVAKAPAGFCWIDAPSLAKMPLTTTAKKALARCQR